MDNIILSLMKEVTYTGWYEFSKDDKSEVTAVVKLTREENIKPRSCDSWNGTLPLPSLPPTGLTGSCTIIDVQYRLELCVDPSGPAFDLELQLPVTLGTISIQQEAS